MLILKNYIPQSTSPSFVKLNLFSKLLRACHTPYRDHQPGKTKLVQNVTIWNSCCGVQQKHSQNKTNQAKSYLESDTHHLQLRTQLKWRDLDSHCDEQHNIVWYFSTFAHVLANNANPTHREFHEEQRSQSCVPGHGKVSYSKFSYGHTENHLPLSGTIHHHAKLWLMPNLKITHQSG